VCVFPGRTINAADGRDAPTSRSLRIGHTVEFPSGHDHTQGQDPNPSLSDLFFPNSTLFSTKKKTPSRAPSPPHPGALFHVCVCHLAMLRCCSTSCNTAVSEIIGSTTICVFAAIGTDYHIPHTGVGSQAGAALAAGCTVVIKPAEDTPLSAEALLALADDVGIPEGVLGLVTCSRESVVDVGTKLATHPSVRKVCSARLPLNPNLNRIRWTSVTVILLGSTCTFGIATLTLDHHEIDFTWSRSHSRDLPRLGSSWKSWRQARSRERRWNWVGMHHSSYSLTPMLMPR
jgi:hypothetical protein